MTDNARTQRRGLTRDWLFDARTALDADDPQSALYAAREALNLNPSSSDAWLVRSQASFALDLCRDAAFEAREAIRLAPSRAENHLALAHALELLHQTDEALHEYQETLRLDPVSKPARVGIAAVYTTKSQTADAVRTAEELVRDHPEDDGLRYLLARALYDDALAHVTSIPGGQYAITSPEQAELARNRADRALAVNFEDKSGLRASLEELQRLAVQATEKRWRRLDRLIIYGPVAFLCLLFAPTGLLSVDTIIWAVVLWAAGWGTVWLFFKRHRKYQWQWATEDAQAVGA